MKILVAIDGSNHSRKALEFACKFALMYQASLIALHVMHEAPGSDTIAFGSASVTLEANQEDLEKAANALFEAARKVAVDSGIAELETVVMGGYPAQKILQYINKNKIDIVVMGSRGLGDLKGLLLGSVSHRVNNLADCTCITVR